MNWMGPRSGGVGVLDAPTSQRDPRSARSWLPVRRHRRHMADAVGMPARPAFDEIATEATSSFRSQAIGMRCGKGHDAAAKVRVVFSSAAHISLPSQLEVWVLLGDVEESRIPPRWDPTQVLADVQLTAWALELRAAALGHLFALDWPDVDSVVVRIDAAERVERRGGWSYVVATAA